MLSPYRTTFRMPRWSWVISPTRSREMLRISAICLADLLRSYHVQPLQFLAQSRLEVPRAWFVLCAEMPCTKYRYRLLFCGGQKAMLFQCVWHIFMYVLYGLPLQYINPLDRNPPAVCKETLLNRSHGYFIQEKQGKSSSAESHLDTRN